MPKHHMTVRADGETYDCTFDMTDDMPTLEQCETMDRDATVHLLGLVQVAEMEQQAADDWDHGGRREWEFTQRQDRYDEREAV